MNKVKHLCGTCTRIPKDSAPICYDVAGENYGHATEVSMNHTCTNWTDVPLNEGEEEVANGNCA